MICLSPGIDKNLSLNPPIDLDVRFIMDNIKIIPENNILTIVNDPIYYPFEDYIQEINSTNIIKFQVKKKNFFLLIQKNFFFLKGINLLSTHSIDLINVRIDNMNNACIPFNFTDISLMCLLPKFILNNIKHSEANVEV